MFTEIENQAIASFVNQAKTVTPEQRAKACKNVKELIRRGERMKYKDGTWISIAAMQETVNQIEVL